MNKKIRIPLSFPRMSQAPSDGITIIAGDVGGTKTNMGFYKATGDDIELVKEATYHSRDYQSFVEMIQRFLADTGLQTPDRICAGVAGPVVHGKVRITNLPEEMDMQDILSKTGVKEVALLNDLEATAYGLAGLNDEDLVILYEGDTTLKGNIAIIAPGTGLGEAGVYWDGSTYHPFPTEGGHCDFSPRTALDTGLCIFLQAKYGIVSWERLVAGPGIHDIYLFLLEKRKANEPGWLTDALQKEDPSAVISKAGVEGRDGLCVETMEIFVRYLARESSNLVLKMKATGGLFLGGGIPPKIAPLLNKELFLKNYFDCDRMEDLLQATPVMIITKDKTALLGAAYYGAYGPAPTDAAAKQ